jgi:hypothetical protein
MLEWIALGDAYGACFEYANPRRHGRAAWDHELGAQLLSR